MTNATTVLNENTILDVDKDCKENVVWIHEINTYGMKDNIHIEIVAKVDYKTGRIMEQIKDRKYRWEHFVGNSEALDWFCEFVRIFQIGPCTHIGKSDFMESTHNKGYTTIPLFNHLGGGAPQPGHSVTFQIHKGYTGENEIHEPSPQHCFYEKAN